VIDAKALAEELVVRGDHVVIVVSRKCAWSPSLGFEDFPWPMPSGK